MDDEYDYKIFEQGFNSGWDILRDELDFFLNVFKNKNRKEFKGTRFEWLVEQLIEDLQRNFDEKPKPNKKKLK